MGGGLGGSAENDRGGHGQGLESTLGEAGDGKKYPEALIRYFSLLSSKQLVITISSPLSWRSWRAPAAFCCSSL